MKNKTVLFRKNGSICNLVLNRPDVFNALNVDVISELEDALATIANDNEIRVVVLEGAGNNFSSGADMELLDSDWEALEWLTAMKRLARLICGLRDLPQPIITKIRGVAIGGGLNLALTGDFVFAAEDVRLRENFIDLYITLDVGGTYYLPRLVGIYKAKELAFLGKEINGKVAESIGLIYKAIPDNRLDDEVNDFAEAISQKHLSGLALIKEAFGKSLELSLGEVLDWEASHQAIALQQKEHKEMVHNFLKTHPRKPNQESSKIN